jgi:hypothetical protein
MTYTDSDNDFSISHPLYVLPSLETWTMVIGSTLIAFALAYWVHISLG